MGFTHLRAHGKRLRGIEQREPIDRARLAVQVFFVQAGKLGGLAQDARGRAQPEIGAVAVLQRAPERGATVAGLAAAPRPTPSKAAPPKTQPPKKQSPQKRSPERQFAQHLIHAAQETKAERMLLFDLRGASPITDYVLIASGRSQGHVRGIADKIEQTLKKSGRYARGVEGYSEGSWILLDYDEVIVHVFHPETRLYYDLDSLLKSYPCETFTEPEGAAEDGAATP